MSLVTETKMQKRPGDWLLLHQQAGTNFDLSPDPKGIDPLIASRLFGVRTNDFPVIILRAAIRGQNCRSLAVHPEQIEPAVTVQVSGIEDVRRNLTLNSIELSFTVAKPYQRAILCSRTRNSRQYQVECTVVVEISDAQTNIIFQNVSCSPAPSRLWSSSKPLPSSLSERVTIAPSA